MAVTGIERDVFELRKALAQQAEVIKILAAASVGTAALLMEKAGSTLPSTHVVSDGTSQLRGCEVGGVQTRAHHPQLWHRQGERAVALDKGGSLRRMV